MTREELFEIQQRLKRATQGEWYQYRTEECAAINEEHWDLFVAVEENEQGFFVGENIACHTANEADAEFLVNAHSDVQKLLLALTEANAALQVLAHAYDTDNRPPDWAVEVARNALCISN